jgi:hypothetical protein
MNSRVSLKTGISSAAAGETAPAPDIKRINRGKQ